MEEKIPSQDYQWSNRLYLNKGAFGTVFKVLQRSTGNTVAIKQLHKNKFPNKQALQFLYKQIEIMKDLRHPNILNLIEIHDAKQSCFLVLQLAQGSLRDILQKKTKIRQQQAAIIFNNLGKGIQFMVQKNYIHRDVKPQNILYRNNQYKIADFGFATKSDIQGRKKMNIMCGTPLYMAPQILQQTPYTSKCDIWSWGLVLFQIIYGVNPWPCRNQMSYKNAIKHTPLRFPYDTPVSDQTKNFIKNCLIFNEQKRMGWSQFLNHDFLKNIHSQSKKMPMKQNYKRALARMSQIIISSKIDIQGIFEQFKRKTGKSSLDQKSFIYFVKKIDKELSSIQAGQLFYLFDNDKSGTIQMAQIINLLNQYDFSNSNKAKKVIQQLKQIIINYKLDPIKLFKNIDSDKSGQLGKTEFKKFLYTVAPGLRELQAEQVFRLIDQDKKGSISVQQFLIALGQENVSIKQTSYARKVLKSLKNVMFQRRIQVSDLMRQFDPDNNGLDSNQFLRLIRKIDPYAEPDEVSRVFIYVSRGVDNITAKQLYQALKSIR